jgi:hypothetical protein
MASEKSLEEQLEKLRQKLMEAGVKILSGNWGGKGGIARYKGQWLVVMDRHLPTNLKLRLLQAMHQLLSVPDAQHPTLGNHIEGRTEETRGDRDGRAPTSNPD